MSPWVDKGALRRELKPTAVAVLVGFFLGALAVWGWYHSVTFCR